VVGVGPERPGHLLARRVMTASMNTGSWLSRILKSDS
jgi:hypothetical protein